MTGKLLFTIGAVIGAALGAFTNQLFTKETISITFGSKDVFDNFELIEDEDDDFNGDDFDALIEESPENVHKETLPETFKGFIITVIDDNGKKSVIAERPKSDLMKAKTLKILDSDDIAAMHVKIGLFVEKEENQNPT